MTALPTSVVLDAAADAIQMAGWSQGAESWENLDGKGLCLEGALAAVLGEDLYFNTPSEPYFDGKVNIGLLEKCPAYVAVKEYLAPLMPAGFTSLWQYNDTFAETSEDVIAVLRSAAAVERLKEQSYDTEDQPLPFDEKAAA